MTALTTYFVHSLGYNDVSKSVNVNKNHLQFESVELSSLTLNTQ